MPWHNEERGRRHKKVWNTENPNRYRVSMSHAVFHRESILDSGEFNDEVDIDLEWYSGGKLGGMRAKRAGYASGYQVNDAVQGQKLPGTFGFGGRRGKDYINLRPHNLGYMNAGKFHPIMNAPHFAAPTTRVQEKTIGFHDDDPVTWSINVGSEIDAGDVWVTPGGGTINYTIRLSGGQSEPIITISEQARNYIWNNEPTQTSAASTDFGVVFHLDWNTVSRVVAGRKTINMSGDAFSWTSELRAYDDDNQLLSAIGAGKVYVPQRAGRADAVKRVWFDGSDWWLFVGAKVSDINLFLSGDLIIDPPISEESITANADDAGQSGTTMFLNGQFSNQVFLGHYSTLYHGGWMFQSVPIGQGETVNSATLEPLQESASGTVNVDIDLFGNDVDNAATFTTTASDITNRVRTTATTNVLSADIPGNTNRASWDVASIVQEVIDRGGWSEGNLAFVGIATNTNTDYVGFTDFNGSAVNAADFNADVTTSGGGGATNPSRMLLTGIG